MSKEVEEYLSLQYETFGECFCYKTELSEVLRMLSNKFDTFNFKIELKHGGFYIIKV
ncbi:MAG: hypothetical protein WA061_02035 [Microgenomates group bacterium]